MILALLIFGVLPSISFGTLMWVACTSVNREPTKKEKVLTIIAYTILGIVLIFSFLIPALGNTIN